MHIHRPGLDWEALRALSSPCRLCPRACGVDRLHDERGFCGAGAQARYYNAFKHFGEEPELVPCFTVFLTGCNFRCPYCSDGEWVVHPERGQVLDPEAMVERIMGTPGLRSVQVVGGLPDVNLPAVVELAQSVPPSLPVVLNSNGWIALEALTLLPPVVDLLLLDVKHAGDPCARALTGVAGYRRHLERVLRRSLSTFRLGVWVRHLVLPGHLGCCTEPVLRWLAQDHPGLVVNVMTQYRPLHQARAHAGLGRTLTTQERHELLPWLRALELPLDLRVDGRPLARG